MWVPPHLMTTNFIDYSTGQSGSFIKEQPLQDHFSEERPCTKGANEKGRILRSAAANRRCHKTQGWNLEISDIPPNQTTTFTKVYRIHPPSKFRSCHIHGWKKKYEESSTSSSAAAASFTFFESLERLQRGLEIARKTKAELSVRNAKCTTKPFLQSDFISLRGYPACPLRIDLLAQQVPQHPWRWIPLELAFRSSCLEQKATQAHLRLEARRLEQWLLW